MGKPLTKWIRRLLVAVAIVLLAAIVFSAGSAWLLRGTPEWYRPNAITPEQRALAARSAEDKFVQTRNWAAEVQVREAVARRRGQQPDGSTAPASFTVAFTEDELNSFFQKWSDQYGWQAAYGKYVSQPVVVLHDGQLILAATVKELGTVLSVHFEPRMDAQGRLYLDLAQVQGGRLPLPEALWASQRDKIVQLLVENLPRWKRNARLDASGFANVSAVAAGDAEILLQALRRSSIEPTGFVPLMDSPRGVAVRLTSFQIDDKSLSLTIEKLTAAESDALLGRVRQFETASSTPEQ